MIKRENILKRIRPFYDNELIKVLVGLRRSGKSVLLHQIMDELLQAGVEKEQIIYMNLSVTEDRMKEDIISFLMRSRWCRNLKG